VFAVTCFVLYLRQIMLLALHAACVSPWLWICVVGLGAGILSMWLYKVCSPQARLNDVVKQLKQSQARLASYDGDMSGAGVLMRATLKLSLQRLGLVLAPSLLAAAPMVAILAVLDHVALDWSEATLSPDWLWTPQGVFLLAATVSALAAKILLHVK
jgi:hypothetical protein